MMHPTCLVKTLWFSLRAGAWVMGHDYKTIAEKTPPNVHVLECETCGHCAVMWSWESLELLK